MDADFDLGVLQNLNHDLNHDQLQMNSRPTPFPFVNVAASARGTMIRIDANTGQIVGEFWTSPNGMKRDPSRTTVDRFGNVWVSNRAEDGLSDGVQKGSVVRIGLIIGGTRSNADGTLNPEGQFLKAPFVYNTCVDRDGDLMIRTSRGLANILDWPNTAGTDINGGVSTAQDECIINYTRVVGTLTRALAVDANNDVWSGGTGNLWHEKLSAVTGMPIPGTQFNLGCGGYGALVDGAGTLWSALGDRGGLLRYLPGLRTGSCLGTGMGNYGLGVDPNTGHIWHTFEWAPHSVCKINPDGTLFGCYGHGAPHAQGVAVDGVGNVWVAHSWADPSTTVGHLRTTGRFIGTVNLAPLGVGPTGVAVDSNGKVWVTTANSHNVQRIDPNRGPIGNDGSTPVGEVDLTIPLGSGALPYNYSDMTGFVVIGTTAPSGVWDVVNDGVVPGTQWGTLSWNGDVFPDTAVKVDIRAADDIASLSKAEFRAVVSGIPFCGSGAVGRFLEIRASLSRSPGTNLSPVLRDLTVSGCAAAACPRSQGFWKAHPMAWKLNGLSLGTAFYTNPEALTVLNTPVRGDASVILAYQLIAAKLNVANGSDPVVVANVMLADSLLQPYIGRIPLGIGTNTAAGRNMTAIAAVLEAYNTGSVIPACAAAR